MQISVWTLASKWWQHLLCQTVNCKLFRGGHLSEPERCSFLLPVLLSRNIHRIAFCSYTATKIYISAMLLCPVRWQKRNNSSARRRCAALVSVNSTALYQSLFVLLGKALVKSFSFKCIISYNSMLLMIWGCDIPVTDSGSQTSTSVHLIFSSHCYFHSSPW